MHLSSVIAQKVDCLAQLGYRVAPGFAGFAHQQSHHAGCIGLQQIGRTLQPFGALCGECGGPRGGKFGGSLQRVLYIG